MTTNVITDAASDLWAAEHDRKPIRPVTESHPGLDLTAAYAVQQVNLRRRLAAGGVLVGRKIGLTSEPMQTLLGVDEPDYGFILDDMVITGDTVATDRFCAPRVEPEIAFLLGDSLRGPDVTTADVYSATEAVAVALEIVDSRIADWKLTLADTVADNASSGAVVLGDWVPYDDALALPHAVADLFLNDAQVDWGTGHAVMGDPAAAFVRSDDVASTTISGLGAVSLTFT